ncbi:MAG: glycosyltransferase [Alicyclobacillus sp.]|nr:glycosyltransferase [Alicyclobacillus sp.]
MTGALWVCGIASIPLLCVYVFYAAFCASLPNHAVKVDRVLGRRLDAAVRARPWHFVFLLPCLNEARVIEQTVSSILRLPYASVWVVVIDDGSDDGTADIVRSMRDPRVRLIRRHLPHARQGKGQALNAAFQRVRRATRLLHLDPGQVIIGVIDGDGRPSANLIDSAILAFTDPRVGAAQARIRIVNRERWLPFMQDLEFAAPITAIQNARAYLGCVGLGGNGQLSRMSALQSLGEAPWTTCLLEDFDLGLRLLLGGWEIRFLGDAWADQQGLTSVRRLIRQRARWTQGNMQCLRYVREIVAAPLGRGAKVELLYFLAQPWLNLLGTVVQAAACVAFALVLCGVSGTSHDVHQTLTLVFRCVCGLTLYFAPGGLWLARHQREFRELPVHRFLLWGMLTSVYSLCCLPSVWVALWRHLARRHAWAKTDRAEERPGSWAAKPTAMQP